MRRKIPYVFFVLLFFSLHAKAMEEPTCTMTNLLEELLVTIFHQEDAHFERFVIFEQVSRQWHRLINSEEFWKLIYAKKYGFDKKINDELTYKRHLINVLLFSLTSEHHKLVGREFPYKAPTFYCQESIFDDSPIAHLIRSCNEGLNRHPSVFCCCYGPFFEGEKTFKPEIKAFFDRALKQDVLVILSGGHAITPPVSCTIDGRDLHEIYPNVIWATLCDLDGKLLPHAVQGQLPDISAPCTNSTVRPIQSIALVAIYLRAIRPSLDAITIRKILLNTGRKTNDIRGGCLDSDAAIEATIKYVFADEEISEESKID